MDSDSIVMFGEYVDSMNAAIYTVSEADIFVIIGTSLTVYPASELKCYAPNDIPRFVIDPGEFSGGMVYDFEHIKTTAVAGVDILKAKLKEL